MSTNYRSIPHPSRRGILLATGTLPNPAIRRLTEIPGARAMYHRNVGEGLVDFTVAMPSSEAWRISGAVAGPQPDERYQSFSTRRDRSYAEVSE